MTRTGSLLLAAALCVAACSKSSESAKPSDTSSASSSTASSSGTTTEPSGQSADARRYGVESGIIKATMDVAGKQELTIYFDDYGRRQAIYTDMTLSMGGKEVTTKQVSITEGATVVTYSPDTKSGTRKPKVATTSDPTEWGFSRMSDADKKKYNYKSIEGREILGKQTVGHQMESDGMTVKAWTWEEIPMYMELTSPQIPTPIVWSVTSVEADVDIPDDKFAVPADVTFDEGPTADTSAK